MKYFLTVMAILLAVLFLSAQSVQEKERQVDCKIGYVEFNYDYYDSFGMTIWDKQKNVKSSGYGDFIGIIDDETVIDYPNIEEGEMLNENLKFFLNGKKVMAYYEYETIGRGEAIETELKLINLYILDENNDAVTGRVAFTDNIMCIFDKNSLYSEMDGEVIGETEVKFLNLPDKIAGTFEKKMTLYLEGKEVIVYAEWQKTDNRRYIYTRLDVYIMDYLMN